MRCGAGKVVSDCCSLKLMLLLSGLNIFKVNLGTAWVLKRLSPVTRGLFVQPPAWSDAIEAGHV